MFSIRFVSEDDRKMYERFKKRAQAEEGTQLVGRRLLHMYADGEIDQLYAFARQLVNSGCTGEPACDPSGKCAACEAAAWLTARGQL